MRTTNIFMYALRLSFKQAPFKTSTPLDSFSSPTPDRIVTRSATMMAVFGIALSSFSLKQMLSSNANKPAILRKF